MTAAEEQGVLEVPDFDLTRGARLDRMRLAWRSWGRLNVGGTNAVLVFHPFGGDRHAAGRRPSGRPGWWSALIGPGLCLDTERYFVVCADVPGGLGESSGPGDRGADGQPLGEAFPELEPRDWARAQAELLEWLGVRRLALAAGGSMGGLQALQWLAVRGAITERALVVAAPPRLGAHARAFCSHIHGLLRLGAPGAALAGGFGQMTYYSEARLSADAQALGGIDALLAKAGEGFAGADPVGLHRLLTAMELFDLGRGGELARSLGGFRGRALLAGFATDWFFRPEAVFESAEALRLAGAAVETRVLAGEDGHNTFLTRPLVLEPLLRTLLSEP